MAAASEVFERLITIVLLVEVVVPLRRREDALSKHAELRVDDNVLRLVVPTLWPRDELLRAQGFHWKVNGRIHTGTADKREPRGVVAVSRG